MTGNIYLILRHDFSVFMGSPGCMLPNTESVCNAQTEEVQGQYTFQEVVSIKMGIWICVIREAESSLLVSRAFYSKNKTGMLQRYLAGNIKEKELGCNGKAHILTTPNLTTSLVKQFFPISNLNFP